MSANYPIKSALIVGAGIGWLGWMASRRRGASDRTTWYFLALLAASGGALAAFAPIAITFMAVAGLAAGIAFEGLRASGVGAIGVGALVVATSALGSPTVLIAEGALSVVVGLVIGASRRQYVQRTIQAEQLLVERVRADAERDRAAALAERNRIGREVHDVLAHSLGALSVQLDAADALLESGDDSTRAASWSNWLGSSPSRVWKRRARRYTRCATSRWLWPSNWRPWPRVTTLSSS